jgi:hypothetical protein
MSEKGRSPLRSGFSGFGAGDNYDETERLPARPCKEMPSMPPKRIFPAAAIDPDALFAISRNRHMSLFSGDVAINFSVQK